MNIQVIVEKKAGHDIPRGYLQTIQKNCPTYHGLTIRSVEEDHPDKPLLETSADHKVFDLDAMCKTLAQLKDLDVTLSFGHVVKDFNPETDMMPFVFQQSAEGGTQDILAVHLEGDFPNYSKPDKGHTDEYHLWEDFIFPTLLDKFEASQDIEDFFRRLRASNFEQAVMNTVSHRAACVFIPLTGEPIRFGRNELGGAFEWGNTSNTFGWGSQGTLAKAAEAAVAVARKGGRLARAMGSTAVSTTTVPEPEKHETKNPPGVHNVPNVPAKVGDDNDPFKKFEGTSADTHQMMEVPVGLQGNARNRWVRTFLGLSSQAELPKGYDRKGWKMPVPLELIGFAQEDVSTNDEVKRLQDRITRFRSPESEEDAQPVAQPKPDEQRPPSDFLPEVSADESKIAADLVTEWATNPKAPTAKEVMTIEKKWPLFTTSRGITLANVARWSIAEKKMFAKKCPNDAARLISELLIKLDEHKEFDQVEAQPGDTEKKQVEVPPVKPGTPAAKGGRLARAKGVAA
jgi:hypothetical protein